MLQNNNLTRLIAFGDSYTYGHYLPDRLTQAWPNCLGSKLDLPVVNKGTPGASNLEILTEILTYDFQPGDLVIVGWTFVQRDIIYKRKTLLGKIFNRDNHSPVGAWRDDDESKRWLMVHNSVDLAIRSGLYIHHADLYLQSIGVTYFNFFTQKKGNVLPQWIRRPNNLLKVTFDRIDLAEDNQHPGIASNQLMADKLYDYIK